MSNPSPPHAAHLASPEVREAIGKALRRRGVRALDTEDLTHDVIVRALGMSEAPPNLQGCLALVRKMATDLAIDKFKIARSRAKYNAGPYENPDDAPALVPTPGQERDPIDAGRQLEVLNREIENGNLTDRQLSIVERKAEEASHVEIASQLQLAPQTVRNELGAARRVARQSWATYLGAALFSTIALFIWLQEHPDRVSRPNPHHDAPAPSEPTPPGPTPLQVAQEQRSKTLRGCDSQLWKECLEGLDHAATIDPAGDADRRVQHARAGARQHLLAVPNENKTAPAPGQLAPK